jgi:hypothetical protein
MKADCFAHPAFHPIPYDRFPECARGSEANGRATLLLRPRKIERGEEITRIAGSLIIDFAEVTPAKNSDGFRKSKSLPKVRRTTNRAWRSELLARR